MFVLYARASALAAARSTARLPASAAWHARQGDRAARRSRGIVYTLAALFSVDAFARRPRRPVDAGPVAVPGFDLSVAAAGDDLLLDRAVARRSRYLVAARIAKRIGLVNTMVFTHLPSSVCLIADPLRASLGRRLALLFIRSLLSQMDVPTRTSYVMAVVPPASGRPRPASPRCRAASPRRRADDRWLPACCPPSAGHCCRRRAQDRVRPDAAAMFRHVRPPEERAAARPVSHG